MVSSKNKELSKEFTFSNKLNLKATFSQGSKINITIIEFAILASLGMENINSFNLNLQKKIIIFFKTSKNGIISLNIPKLLEIVGTFTREASTHLFSLFAALKIFSSIGAKFISTLAINSGNFFQSTNFFFGKKIFLNH